MPEKTKEQWQRTVDRLRSQLAKAKLAAAEWRLKAAEGATRYNELRQANETLMREVVIIASIIECPACKKPGIVCCDDGYGWNTESERLEHTDPLCVECCTCRKTRRALARDLRLERPRDTQLAFRQLKESVMRLAPGLCEATAHNVAANIAGDLDEYGRDET